MKWLFGLTLAVPLAFGAEKPSYILDDKRAAKIKEIKDEKAQRAFGGELAGFMRALRPVNAVNGVGKMKIRPPRGKRREVPIRFRTFALGAAVINEYATALGTLTVTRRAGKEAEYHWAPPAPGKPRNLNGRQAETPFAGSDFWIADLGLQFLDWPNQKLLKRIIKRGELCSVLESSPAKAAMGRYSKIVSYVDEDSMGIVHADVYDAKGKLLKEFSPRSFAKINGQWHLKEMEMRNEQADSRTAIIFDLKAAPVKEAAPKK